MGCNCKGEQYQEKTGERKDNECIEELKKYEIIFGITSGKIIKTTQVSTSKREALIEIKDCNQFAWEDDGIFKIVMKSAIDYITVKEI